MWTEKVKSANPRCAGCRRTNAEICCFSLLATTNHGASPRLPDGSSFAIDWGFGLSKQVAHSGWEYSVPSARQCFTPGGCSEETSPRHRPALSEIPRRLFGGPYLVMAGAAWLPWLYKYFLRFGKAFGVTRRYRVGKQHLGPLCNILMHFTNREMIGQPLPNKDRTDDRYELLGKLQNILEHLGYSGIIVLMDRLDEPHLINGQSELMQAFLWPLLDNKFLKHPGMGIKMMLPIELRRFIDREESRFLPTCAARQTKHDTVTAMDQAPRFSTWQTLALGPLLSQANHHPCGVYLLIR